MPPDDPLGRHGPSLDNFLRIKPTAPDHPPQTCPYGKKCTYGNKCKFFHPERQANQKPISQKLKEQDESRKRLKAILDDYRPEDYRGYQDASMHGGVRTEPLPRPPSLDNDMKSRSAEHSRTGPLPGYRHPANGVASNSGSESGSNPHLETAGASAAARQFVPYNVSGFGEPYHPLPPQHIHGGEGHYYTEPLPRSASPQVETGGAGTVPLAHLPRHMQSSRGAVPRHSSLPPDGGAGPYSGLIAAMDQVRIGSESSSHQDRRYSGDSG